MIRAEDCFKWLQPLASKCCIVQEPHGISKSAKESIANSDLNGRRELSIQHRQMPKLNHRRKSSFTPAGPPSD